MRIYIEPGKGVEIATWLQEADIELRRQSHGLGHGVQHHLAKLMHCAEAGMTPAEAAKWSLENMAETRR